MSNTTVDSANTDDAFTRLEAERALPGRERVATPATWFLVALLGLGAAFIGGAWWGQRNVLAAAATTPATGAAAGAGAQARSTAAATGQSAAAPTATTAAPTVPTSGTIKLVDGRNVYVSTADGRTVKLVLGADGKVQVPTAGELADLTAGQLVTWSGTPNADGTVAAATITRG
jgi:zona occludens toxin (predicted ATPase)